MTDRILDTEVVAELESSYGDYAYSVVVGRNLPDVRDGLKPVHRRILFGMHEGKFFSSEAYRKSARVVGDVMGKYHPHGDSAIYDALVRMAQPFSMSLPFVDGQGNFGSIDDDPAAAMRYTEARLEKSAEIGLLADLSRDAVDFRPTYDNENHEPVVLPAAFPNLLVNGSEGIAVGLATKIPPHALGEVCAATLMLLGHADLSDDDLLQVIPAPDFPTGGLIVGSEGLREYHQTGQGSLRIRARHHEEDIQGGRRTAIILTEIPYQVIKSALETEIVQEARKGTLQGISAVRDESNKEGIRLVIELQAGTDVQAFLAQLWKHTRAQISFSVNLLAIADGRPKTMGVREVLTRFLVFRRRTVRRCTVFELREAQRRAHLILGRLLAVSSIDEVVRRLRAAGDDESAIRSLCEMTFANPSAAFLTLFQEVHDSNDIKAFHLSERQAKDVLDMPMRRLIGLQRDRLELEATTLAAEMGRLKHILAHPEALDEEIRKELLEIQRRFATPRRTEVIPADERDAEALIPRRPVAVIVTKDGFVRRSDLSSFRAQNRGGKGRSGAKLRDEDAVAQLIVCSSHDAILFLTSAGRALRIKAWALPEGDARGRGRALINVFPMDEHETIVALVAMPQDVGGKEIVFVLEDGRVRRNRAEDFVNVMRNGKRYLDTDHGTLKACLILDEVDDLLLTTAQGLALRFPVSDLRQSVGRSGAGVRGIRLEDNDRVVAACGLPHAGASVADIRAWRKGEATQELADVLEKTDQMVLALALDGFGRRSSSHIYRLTGRGGKGFKEGLGDHGAPMAMITIEDGQDVLVLTQQGRSIRASADNIRITGRSAQGVRLLQVPKGDYVMGLVAVDPESLPPEDPTEES